MTRTIYVAWRYLVFHKFKVAILVASITLIVYLPIGLRVLVGQSARQLTSRAASTPLLVGAKGSPLELVLNSLYFGSEVPATLDYGEVARVRESALAQAIPLYTRFRARGYPIVGTTPDYLEFRGLRVSSGRRLGILGECLVGHRVARALGVGPDDTLVSSPESVFDLAGVYPLKMNVAGVLAYSDTPDDDAVFVDLKTAWVIAGLGHGHQDLSRPEASAGVLAREGNRVTANASVVQYNEITDENLDSFHFHGDLAGYPITALIAVPPDRKSATLLRGRYESRENAAQIVLPAAVMDELLGTILTVQNFVIAGAVVVGAATLAVTILVFALSLRLRRRERETLFKIGGSRNGITAIMASEVAAVLIAGVLLAAGLTLLTSQFGSIAIRTLIRS